MRSSIAIRFGLRALGALCALAVLAGAAQAAELVMFRRDGCPWCARWDREIGPAYAKTEIGRRAPLRMLDLDRASAQSVRVRTPVIYTPTFVLVEQGAEVGRIEGYAGDAFFWGQLERLLGELPPSAGKSSRMQSPAFAGYAS